MTQSNQKPEQAPKSPQQPSPAPDHKAAMHPEKHDEKKDSKVPQDQPKGK